MGRLDEHPLGETLVNTIPLILTCYEHTLSTHLPGFVVPRKVIIGNLGRSLDDILRDRRLWAGLLEAPKWTQRHSRCRRRTPTA